MLDCLNEHQLVAEILSFHFDGERKREGVEDFKEYLEYISDEAERGNAPAAPPFMEGDVFQSLYLSLEGFQRNIFIYDINFNIIYEIDNIVENSKLGVHIIFHDNLYYLIHNIFFIDVLKNDTTQDPLIYNFKILLRKYDLEFENSAENFLEIFLNNEKKT